MYCDRRGGGKESEIHPDRPSRAHHPVREAQRGGPGKGKGKRSVGLASVGERWEKGERGKEKGIQQLLPFSGVGRGWGKRKEKEAYDHFLLSVVCKGEGRGKGGERKKKPARSCVFAESLKGPGRGRGDQTSAASFVRRRRKRNTRGIGERGRREPSPFSLLPLALGFKGREKKKGYISRVSFVLLPL